MQTFESNQIIMSEQHHHNLKKRAKRKLGHFPGRSLILRPVINKNLNL